MARTLIRLGLVLFVCLAPSMVGCGSAVNVGEPTISDKSYDRTCKADSDCLPVLVGKVCACDCVYGAINKVDKTDYDDDRKQLTVTCTEIRCGVCQEPRVRCDRGACVR